MYLEFLLLEGLLLRRRDHSMGPQLLKGMPRYHCYRHGPRLIQLERTHKITIAFYGQTFHSSVSSSLMFVGEENEEKSLTTPRWRHHLMQLLQQQQATDGHAFANLKMLFIQPTDQSHHCSLLFH